MDKRVLIAVGVLMLIVGGIVTFKILNKSKEKKEVAIQSNFTVSPQEILAGEPISFSDHTQGAQSWYWEFGDGDFAETQSGTHTYTEDGTYTVLLSINGKFVDSTLVVVKPLSVTAAEPEESVKIAISGPKTAKVGEKVTFTDNTPGTTTTHWKFGESGMEDAIAKTASYVYSRPGKYHVIATNDVSPEQATMLINILPNMPARKEKRGGGNVIPQMNDNELRGKLIALTKGFESGAFRSIVKSMCDRDDIPVTFDGNTKDLYSYCQRLGILQPKIISVRQNRDPQTKCVTSITVTEQQ